MTFEIYLVGGRDLMIIVLVFDDAEIPVNVIAEISDRNPTKNIPPGIGLETPRFSLNDKRKFLDFDHSRRRANNVFCLTVITDA
jgi:hypothetical protein